ncbi:hypothetical protein BFW01_g1658 [Lasiodiplodia theobromae]|nr:hypothetical protein BFW01_g1658 [Lasiodiplodia theobromae]
MYNSRNVAIHVGLKVLTPLPQKEIILSDFNFCFSCRAGACPKHEGPGTSFNSIQEAQQQEQSTRQGVSILAQLPAELACQVALALPSQTFFSIRHIPELEAFWAANEAHLVREKAAQYAAEAHFFPSDLFTGAGGGGGGGSVLAQHQQLLYLEVIRTCTAAVTDYFTTTLDLPAALSARLRSAVLRLWRVVGVPHRSSVARMRQQAMDSFCSLPQAERADIFALFADVGEHIERAHPFAQRRRADNVPVPMGDGHDDLPGDGHDDMPTREMMAAFRASGAWKHVCGFLANETIRAAMRGAFTLAAASSSAGTGCCCCNDVDADAVGRAVDEMRLGAPPWTVWDPDSWESHHPLSPLFPTDQWGYLINTDYDATGTIYLETPAEHFYGSFFGNPNFCKRDDYIAFGLAQLLPDGWTLNTRRFFRAFGSGLMFPNTTVGAVCGPMANGDEYKFDQQHASDEDKAELMEALMEIAFKLVPDESQ